MYIIVFVRGAKQTDRLKCVYIGANKYPLNLLVKDANSWMSEKHQEYAAQRQYVYTSFKREAIFSNFRIHKSAHSYDQLWIM